MWAHPGKKLLFMGGEFAQRREWTHDGELDWWAAGHAGPRRRAAAGARPQPRLSRRARAARSRLLAATASSGSRPNDAAQSVLRFLRAARDGAPVLVVCNFTPVPRQTIAWACPRAGTWREVLNSDARVYGGAGWGNLGGVDAAPVRAHGRAQSLCLTLPPLSTILPAHASDPAAEPSTSPPEAARRCAASSPGREPCRRALPTAASTRRHRRRAAERRRRPLRRQTRRRRDRDRHGALLHRRPRRAARHAGLVARRRAQARTRCR